MKTIVYNSISLFFFYILCSKISLSPRLYIYFFHLFLPPVALGSCVPFISDCINVFRSRYKAVRIALRMYCSRILIRSWRYEYTRCSYVTILTSAVSPLLPRTLYRCISSRNFIPRLSHVYVSTTHHLREYTQQVTASTELTATVYSTRAISFCFCNILRVF